MDGLSGAMAFVRTNGALQGVRLAGLTGREVAPGTSGSTLRRTVYVVPRSTPSPVCLHHLTVTKTSRKNLEHGFRAASMTGSSAAGPRRVGVELQEATGFRQEMNASATQPRTRPKGDARG